MSDRINSELAALITPPPSTGVQFTQGRVLSWDNDLLGNQIEWRGITLTDVSLVEGISALTIREGDIVGMLGWAPENAKGVGSWWIIGKLSNPGEFVADLNITAKFFRLETREGYPLAFFGEDSSGDPLWILYYGGADSQAAIRTINGEYISMTDRSGYEIFATDAATDVGIARPYLNYLISPSFDTSVVTNGPFWPSTTSTSYLEQYRGNNTVWHPRVSLGVRAVSTGGSPEWRFRVDHGTGPITVASGSGYDDVIFEIPGWGTDVHPGDTVIFSLDARNSGGTTWTTIDELYGRQT